jgi:methylmalonyl-CoA mutase cobalamin-binding subunit
MSGELQIFEEHIYSESVQLVLRQAIHALPPQGQSAGPRVLLTTLPGEGHALGLLMAEALLSLDGAVCLSLGVQTPLAQLTAAAIAFRADVVALSFSGQLPTRAVLDGLAALRELLPTGVEIWAGGASRALRLPGCPQGVRCLDGLAVVGLELARWRELLESNL